MYFYAFVTVVSLALLQVPTTAKPLKHDRIAIIGAGFSGLSTAHFLVRRGYTNITLYEATGRIGGYVSSVEYNGVQHDLSTYATTALYWKFMSEMRSLGAQFCTFTSNVIDTSANPPRARNTDEFLLRLAAASLENQRTLLLSSKPS